MTAPRRQAVVATGNEHKLIELRRALPGWELEVLGLETPPEIGASYEENARLKARFGRAHASAEAWVLGEDSGIEADGLGGRPGVLSARWAGDGVARMLAELADNDERSGRYCCVIVALAPDGAEQVATGTLEGRIERVPRGGEGFGYDPIFVPAGEQLTVAELGNKWKQTHSHRARAARALAEAVGRSPQG